MWPRMALLYGMFVCVCVIVWLLSTSPMVHFVWWLLEEALIDFPLCKRRGIVQVTLTFQRSNWIWNTGVLECCWIHITIHIAGGAGRGNKALGERDGPSGNWGDGSEGVCWGSGHASRVSTTHKKSIAFYTHSRDGCAHTYMKILLCVSDGENSETHTWKRERQDTDRPRIPPPSGCLVLIRWKSRPCVRYFTS